MHTLRASSPADEGASAVATAVAEPMVALVAPANPASRTFTFDAEQLEVVQHLRNSISNCAMAFSATFATNVFLSCAQVGLAGHAAQCINTTPLPDGLHLLHNTQHQYCTHHTAQRWCISQAARTPAAVTTWQHTPQAAQPAPFSPTLSPAPLHCASAASACRRLASQT